MRKYDLHAVGGDERFVRYVHAPAHLFRAGATYFITARTLHGYPYAEMPARRRQVIEALHFASERRGWRPVAWVALTNHYHCNLQAPAEGASTLPQLIAAVHKFTALAWNREDEHVGRTVWYQYRDTCLTHERSFYGRLNYIHHNPVKHGLVSAPDAYPFSSYSLWRSMEDVDLPLIEGGYPWEWLDLE